jgi:hypothetical protein
LVVTIFGVIFAIAKVQNRKESYGYYNNR